MYIVFNEYCPAILKNDVFFMYLVHVHVLPVTVSATEPPHEKKVEILDGFPCDHCALEFEEFEGLDSHICAVETAKLGGCFFITSCSLDYSVKCRLHHQ